MSIYCRDEVSPEWEPSPWPIDAEAADEQERGFHQRAQMFIGWAVIPWRDFPPEGLFGHEKDRLASSDVAYFASIDAEDFFLVDNTWHGFPDPPRWGLISCRDGQWKHWGHFPKLPSAWDVPDHHDDPKSKLQQRPMPGSEAIPAWGSILAGSGAALSLGGFIASFIPGVQVDGNPLWFLAGAAVFAGVSGVFYLAHKLVRRLR